MSESKLPEPAATESESIEPSRADAKAEEPTTKDTELTKPSPIDAEASKKESPESAAPVTAKSDPPKPHAPQKPSLPPINLKDYSSTVKPPTTRLTGPSSPEVASSLAEKTEGLNLNSPDSVPQTDGNADVKTIETSPEFKQLASRLVKILEEVKHEEMWGVTLVWPAETHVPTQIVLQKFLNANDNEVTKAEEQLTAALKWRKETKPLDLVKRRYDEKKFDDLGYVTSYQGKEESHDVFTWNVYGSAGGKIEQVFGDLKEFMEWRVALQELGLQALNIAAATKPITATYDPYKIYQVHDYKDVMFFSQPPTVKAASKEVIRVFSQNYPELLKEKFFVNVPAVMGWVYAAIKLVIAAKTAKKFHPMANGANLSREFPSELGEKLPTEYGGEGENKDKAALRLWSDGGNKA